METPYLEVNEYKGYWGQGVGRVQWVREYCSVLTVKIALFDRLQATV